MDALRGAAAWRPASSSCPGPNAAWSSAATATTTRPPWSDLAEQAGWPVLAEPSSGARRGPNALPAYQYLLATPEFAAAYRPDVIVSAGRPGLSRPQSALLAGPAARHVVIGQGPGPVGRPAAGRDRRRRGRPAGRRARQPAGRRHAVAGARGAGPTTPPGTRRTPSWTPPIGLTEPGLARDLVPAVPAGRTVLGGQQPARSGSRFSRPAPRLTSASWPAGGPAASTGPCRRPSARPWPTAARRSPWSVTWPSCTTRPGWPSGRPSRGRTCA